MRKDLRCLYKIGRSNRKVEVSSSKDKVIYTYENSIVTNLGNYKEKEWESLVLQQAMELLEVDIFEELKKYSFNNLAWINTDEEAHKYALQLYSSRIWENEKWVGYEVFKQMINKDVVAEQMSLI